MLHTSQRIDQPQSSIRRSASSSSYPPLTHYTTSGYFAWRWVVRRRRRIACQVLYNNPLRDDTACLHVNNIWPKERQKSRSRIIFLDTLNRTEIDPDASASRPLPAIEKAYMKSICGESKFRTLLGRRRRRRPRRVQERTKAIIHISAVLLPQHSFIRLFFLYSPAQSYLEDHIHKHIPISLFVMYCVILMRATIYPCHASCPASITDRTTASLFAIQIPRQCRVGLPKLSPLRVNYYYDDDVIAIIPPLCRRRRRGWLYTISAHTYSSPSAA